MLTEQAVERDPQVESRAEGCVAAGESVTEPVDDPEGQTIANHEHVRIRLANRGVGVRESRVGEAADLLQPLNVLVDEPFDDIRRQAGVRFREERAEVVDVGLELRRCEVTSVVPPPRSRRDTTRRRSALPLPPAHANRSLSSWYRMRSGFTRSSDSPGSTPTLMMAAAVARESRTSTLTRFTRDVRGSKDRQVSTSPLPRTTSCALRSTAVGNATTATASASPGVWHQSSPMPEPIRTSSKSTPRLASSGGFTAGG